MIVDILLVSRDIYMIIDVLLVSRDIYMIIDWYFL